MTSSPGAENEMQIGVIYPQMEMESDAGAIREFAIAVEAMGYTHITAYDHVLGANLDNRPDWKGPYHMGSAFQEPLVLFSYMAAVTTQLGFFTGILILPQRQAALVAKQTASVDIFCNGRLRLGIGTGWNEIEYEALDMSFAERGSRIEDQIDVLRKLWTQDSVTIDSEFHKISEAGINPMPIQRPIPIWIGGGSDRPAYGEKANEKVIRRIARVADGWFPMWEPGPRADELMAKFRGYCHEYGRDPDQIGLEGSFVAARSEQDRWPDEIAAWRAIGATHISVITMGDGLKGANEHLRRLEELRTVLE